MWNIFDYWIYTRQIFSARRSLNHFSLPLLRYPTHDKIAGVGPVLFAFGIFFAGILAIHRSYSTIGMIPTKWLKYIPMESGGNAHFPLTLFIGLGWRFINSTKWNSFDQRSFFPHTDRFKLRTAIVEDNLPLLKVILDRGKIHIDIPLMEQSETPAIGLAAMLGRMQVLEYLRDRGADINKQDKFGNTPLMLAVIHQQDSSLEFLINSGADLSLRDKYGYNAIEKAANRGYTQTEEFLAKQKQRERPITVNPITPTLEKFAYLRKPNAKEYVHSYDPGSLYLGQEYPYYTSTQGFLLCLFGNYSSDLSLRSYLPNWTKPNPMDEKASTSQEFFSFGRMIQESLDRKEAAEKIEKEDNRKRGA